MLDTAKLEETTRKEMLKKFELIKKYGADVTTGRDMHGEGLQKSASNLLKKVTNKMGSDPSKRNLSVQPSRPAPRKLAMHQRNATSNNMLIQDHSFVPGTAEKNHQIS